MQDIQRSNPDPARSEDWIGAVANRALAVVAREKSGASRRADPTLISLMRTCLLSGDREACRSTVRLLTENGIDREAIADLYIPALARQLGEDWCDDVIGFAEVTIGSSKLQALLRELGPEWRADHAGAVDAPAALVLVDADEHHTLGAQLMAGRMRRDGLSVRVALSADRGEIDDLLRRADYDIILISTSRPEALDSVRKLVEFVRSAVEVAPPVVIGGAIQARGVDIRARTGADFVTNDIDEALHLCGLKKSSQKGPRLNRRR